MKKRRIVVCALLLSRFGSTAFPSSSAAATPPPDDSSVSGKQVRGDYVYEKPSLFTFVKRQPGDLKDFWTGTFRKENTGGIIAMAVGTGVLIVADHDIFKEMYRWGDKMNISHESTQKSYFKINAPFTSSKWGINGPHDLATGMYFLGDGVLHTGITGGFLAYGLATSDNRALQTSSQLAEGIIANGIVVQILKHATGRENPNTETSKGGKWRFFPNQTDYHKHVNKYDAFPSGHLSTAMVTVTVIAENYPEYRLVRPVGYTLMAALSYQMVNNGVHWVSDYPLAVYMGYVFGKITVDKGRRARSQTARNDLRFGPVIVGDGFGLRVGKRFGNQHT